jgi:uncharacterized membrane protein
MTENATATESNSSRADGCRGGGRVDAVVQSLNGWTLLFIGAITIAVTERITDEFVSAAEPYETLAIALIALCLVYGQLALAYYGRRLLS